MNRLVLCRCGLSTGGPRPLSSTTRGTVARRKTRRAHLGATAMLLLPILPGSAPRWLGASLTGTPLLASARPRPGGRELTESVSPGRDETPGWCVFYPVGTRQRGDPFATGSASRCRHCTRSDVLLLPSLSQDGSSALAALATTRGGRPLPWQTKTGPSPQKLRPGGGRGYNVRVTTATSAANATALTGRAPLPASEPEVVGLLGPPPPLEPEEAVGLLLGVGSPSADADPPWAQRASHSAGGRAGRWGSGQASHAAGLRSPTGGAGPVSLVFRAFDTAHANRL